LRDRIGHNRTANAERSGCSIVALRGWYPTRCAAMNSQDYGEPPKRKDGGTISTNRARQGVTGHNVRYVLLVGIVGVVVAFAIAYIVYFA
jgi:hypothetical protein